MKTLLAILFAASLAAQVTTPQDSPKPSPPDAPAPTPTKDLPAKPVDKPTEPKPAEQQPADREQKPADQKPDQPSVDAPQQPSGPVPAGADPQDLRVLRSAEAMIEAERRLGQLIKEGKITGLDKIVTFDELSAWPYEDGLKGMPKRVRELDGKKVLMSGFMLPIDEVQNIKEFLLVQSLWSCCYGQPPDINGIVRVVMPKGKTTDYFFDPIKIIGRFKVEATVIDGYCVDIYQLEAESLEALQGK